MITTEDALELMTFEQMMLTRKRQIAFELEKNISEARRQELDTEYWALKSMLRENEKLEGEHLESLKQAIKENRPPQ